MKRNYKRIAISLALAVIVMASMAVMAGAQMNGKMKMNQQATKAAPVATAAVTEITEAEKASLVYMREEEKLAHDVYVALDAVWGKETSVFGRIAASELRHMESVAYLLEKFGIEDPAEGRAAGVFKNAQLQALYNDLVAKGKVSLVAALGVGAAIEDLDISDLDETLVSAKNTYLIRVYENLKDGSESHLRAFYMQLKAEGGEYKPVHVSQESFDAIVSGKAGASQSGFGAGKGMGKGYARPGKGAMSQDCECDEDCEVCTQEQQGKMLRNGK